MLEKQKRTSLYTTGQDKGRYGKGKQYVRPATESQSHIPALPRYPAVQTEKDAELHAAAKAEMRRWLKSQGTTLTKLLKRRKRRK